MKWIKFTYKAFMSEPKWFKFLIITTLLISIIFSHSSFNGYIQSIAKLATAIFFGAYGFKLRKNRFISVIFFVLAVGSIYLSWNILNTTTSGSENGVNEMAQKTVTAPSPEMEQVEELEQSDEEEFQAIFSSESTLSIDSLIAITEHHLLAESSEEKVIEVLGEPHTIETSQHLNSPNEKLRIGESWRYEHPQAHYIVTLYDGAVERWQLQLPFKVADQRSIDPTLDPNFKYHVRSYPFVPSIEPVWKWRNQGELAYPYLWEGTDEILLLRGDDGGFSGHHHDSNLYAVDRESGEKLWQIDAGYAGIDAVLSDDQEYIAVFTRFNPKDDIHENHLRYVRLSDGTITWEQKWNEKNRFQMTGLKDVILLHSQTNQNGELFALDASTGNTIWEKSFDEPFHLLNEGLKEPYVLIQHDHHLEALDPRIGVKQWSINWEGSEIENHIVINRTNFVDHFYDAFHKHQSSKWICKGNECRLIQLATGEIETTYSAEVEEFIIAINDRYWLIQRSSDGTEFWQAEQFETVFYDAKNGKEVWTRQGRGASPVLEDNVLYTIWDGVPTAIHVEDGSTLWEMENVFPPEAQRNFAQDNLLLYKEYILLPYHSEILVLRKDNGTLQYRVEDIMFGFPDQHGRKRVQRLNQDDNNVYVGSANGLFSKFVLEDIDLK